MRDVGKKVLVVVLTVVLIVGVWFGYLYLLKPALNLEREAIQHSQQYVETKQSLLLQLASEYNKTEDEAQKRVLVEKMRLESERIPYDQVPSSVRSILRDY